MNWKLVFMLLLVFLQGGRIRASEVIVLDRDGLDKEYFFHGQHLDLLEDKTGTLTLKDILSSPYKDQFEYDKIKVSGNYNLDTYYWGRFTVQNNSGKPTGWVMELYDFKIDYFEVYIPDANGGFVKKTGGDLFDFDKRDYPHKNFVFDLPELAHKASHTFYFRIYSKEPIAIIGVVRTTQRFLHYATMEYYLLALFYGVLLTIGLYNVVLFFSVREVSYLFLASYILAFGVYCMTQDGTGFQFFWSKSPALNNYVHHFVRLVIMVSILLYARSFLMAKTTLPKAKSWMGRLIIVRTFLFLLSLAIPHALLFKFLFLYDFLTTFIIFLGGIYSYSIKKYIPAKFYVMAFASLFIGFFFTLMHSLRWMDVGVYLGAYAFNGGAILQIFLLSLSVGQRMRMLIREKEQMKENVKMDLEIKVAERTAELEEKNRQLDSFVYKASHDIKGPLKSIIGLTSVALSDIKDPAAHEYFHHILKSTNRLDTLLHDLLSLTKMQREVALAPVPIQLSAMMQDIWFSFKNLEETACMHFELSEKGEQIFYSDHKLVYSICQNIIENAIKYRDHTKPTCTLYVTLHTSYQGAEIIFTDNGIGIPSEHKDKIFDMFSKVHASSNGFGLGLHLVQLSLQKLQGTVEVSSKEGEGSVFAIKLPQLGTQEKVGSSLVVA